jgi:repressor LexA
MNRLRFLRNEKGESLEKIAKFLNVTIQTISNYETEKRDMNPDTILKLSEYFGVSTDYLLGKSDARNNTSNIDESDKKFYMCPVYGQISAGQPNWAEECIEGRLPLDPDLMGIVNPEEHFFLRVNGESMNKVVRNGAFALIHKQDMVDDGEIAVVLVNGYDATLKKFTRQGDMIILEPQSNDDSFKTQVYDKNTPIKILGKYVGKMEINK